MKNKKCSRCGKLKEFSEFSKYKYSSDGLQRWCKNCMSEHRRKYYLANRKRLSQRAFIRNHGVGLAYKNFLLASQGWACAICGKELKPNSSEACLDHSHETGKIRGVLCKSCNTSIGHYGDNFFSVVDSIKEKGFEVKRSKACLYLLLTKLEQRENISV